MSLITTIIAAVIILVFLYLAIKFMRKLIINSVLGLIFLGILHYIFGVNFIHWLAVFVVSVIFGIPGILVALILKFFGVNV